MQTDTKGLHTVKSTLKDGTVRVYRYHRETRRKIHTEPGTRAFAAEFGRAAAPRQGDKLTKSARVGSKATHGHVYFVAADALGLVKIGWSKNVVARLRTLQAASPVTLRLVASFPGVNQHETQMHARFAHLRQRGEWFTMADEITAFVATL